MPSFNLRKNEEKRSVESYDLQLAYEKVKNSKDKEEFCKKQKIWKIASFIYIIAFVAIIFSFNANGLSDETDKALIEQIISGDFSGIEESDVVSIEELESVYKNISEDTEWTLCELNSDGIEDLIWRKRENSGQEKEIIGIFDIEGKGKCVFWDEMDAGEYFFVADNGNLIYYSQYFGIYDYMSFEKNIYDRSWNRELETGLYIYNIYDVEEILYWFDEHDHTNMTENGIYFLRYADGVEEIIEEKEFVEEYKEIPQLDTIF